LAWHYSYTQPQKGCWRIALMPGLSNIIASTARRLRFEVAAINSFRDWGCTQPQKGCWRIALMPGLSNIIASTARRLRFEVAAKNPDSEGFEKKSNENYRLGHRQI
jgi:hypothetical protein